MAGRDALATLPQDVLHGSCKLILARIGLLPLRLGNKQGAGLG
jgi:hypothetical protein